MFRLLLRLLVVFGEELDAENLVTTTFLLLPKSMMALLV